jgi:hypothetical protein
MATRDGGRILAVPYQQEINDIPHSIARQARATVRSHRRPSSQK